jgi:predicted transcriptional regulator YdeE
MGEQATTDVEVVNRSYQFVGMSVTATFPDSFPEAAIRVQTEFWGRRGEIRQAKNADVLFSPGMCNGIVATYFACLEVMDLSSVPEGMIGFALPAMDYAKTRCTNKTIGDGYDTIFAWCKENGYEHRQQGAMQIEVFYIDDDVDEEPVDVLIPISTVAK